MESRRFDAMTRMLAAGPISRRAGVGALAGALAARLSRAGSAPAAAACARVGKKCDKNSDCCRGARCRRGRCQCRRRFKPCSGRCRDLKTDRKHCGECGRRCEPGQLCAGGTCLTGQGTCPAGADVCTGTGARCDADDELVFGCLCMQTQQGTTRCGMFAPDATCGECTRDADCARLGPGAFCFRNTDGGCCSGSMGDFCAVACPRCDGESDCPPGCACALRLDGRRICASEEPACQIECTTTDDCPGSEQCVVEFGCGGSFCRPFC